LKYLYEDYHVEMAVTLAQLGEDKERLPSGYDFAYAMFTLEVSIDAVSDRLGRHVRESMTVYRQEIAGKGGKLAELRASYKGLGEAKSILTAFITATTWKAVCEAFD
jgi:hypothetical protein